ncbi:unnamed protein product [Pedinophyceae sp. YPF-701]|nr:unnamed protein product [Pedinophyceae sp. YPF-701]
MATEVARRRDDSESPNGIRARAIKAIAALKVGTSDHAETIRDDIHVDRAAVLTALAPARHGFYNIPEEWQLEVIKTPRLFYKVVSADDKDRVVSVYDGNTEYHLGMITSARRGAGAWPPLDAALYCWPTQHQATASLFPRGSKMKWPGSPHFLMAAEVWGRAYRHVGSGVWAVEFLRPTKFVTTEMGDQQRVDN